jgi:glycosyltransferase involved in cell wall biosynthesis
VSCRLAVVVSGFPRRSETFALNELLALEERGMLAGIFATKSGDAAPLQPGAARLAPMVELLPAGDAGAQGHGLALRLAGRNVSGVHAYFAHTPAEVAEHAATRLSVPFGFSVHARDARKVDDSTLEARAMRAACVIACNRDVARELGPAAGRAHIMPHGVDLARFAPVAPPDAPPFRILAVGRLVAKKGFDVLIAALSQLDDRFTLRIVGDGPERPRLDAAVAARRLAGRVTFAGPATHEGMPVEYASAHVVVVPSIVDPTGDRDGLPNVVLEAMACGRPVVGTSVGAIDTAVEDGHTGYLVAAGSPSAIAQAVEQLASDEGRRRAMGREGRRLVERRFDLRQCSTSFANLLEGVYA